MTAQKKTTFIFQRSPDLKYGARACQRALALLILLYVLKVYLFLYLFAVTRFISTSVRFHRGDELLCSRQIIDAMLRAAVPRPYQDERRVSSIARVLCRILRMERRSVGSPVSVRKERRESNRIPAFDFSAMNRAVAPRAFHVANQREFFSASAIIFSQRAFLPGSLGSDRVSHSVLSIFCA